MSDNKILEFLKNFFLSLRILWLFDEGGKKWALTCFQPPLKNVITASLYGQAPPKMAWGNLYGIMVYQCVSVGSVVISDRPVENHIFSSWILSLVNDALLCRDHWRPLCILMRKDPISALQWVPMGSPGGRWLSCPPGRAHGLPTPEAQSTFSSCCKDHYLPDCFHCCFCPKCLWEWALLIPHLEST